MYPKIILSQNCHNLTQKCTPKLSQLNPKMYPSDSSGTCQLISFTETAFTSKLTERSSLTTNYDLSTKLIWGSGSSTDEAEETHIGVDLARVTYPGPN